MRPFEPTQDFPARVALWNACYPEHPKGNRDLQREDDLVIHDPALMFRRWLLEREGQVIGMAQFVRPKWHFNPHRFRLSIELHPDYQGVGLGTQLYAFLLSELAPYHPQTLLAQLWSENTAAVGWVQKAGYKLDHRVDELRRDLTTFDPAPYVDIVNRLRSEGIEILSMAEAHNSMPDFLEQMYALETLVTPDVPGNADMTLLDFATWLAEDFLLNEHDQQAAMVAVCDGKIIGESQIWLFYESLHCHFWLAAVHPDFRGKGLAKALKAAVLAEAQALGKTHALSTNDESNAPMQSVNQALGFYHSGSWLFYEKELI